MAQTVKNPHAEYSRLKPLWRKCRDASAGQDAIHAAGTVYLPMLKDQDPIAYAVMVMRTGFFNATWRTIDGLRGLIFRRPPTLKVPDAIVLLLEDIDLAGKHVNAFLKDITEEDLTVGRVGILVDYPMAGEQTTLLEARKNNERPSMVMFKTECILDWKYERIGNKTVLTQVRLDECYHEVIDEFTSSERQQIRVLDLSNGFYRVRFFRFDEAGNQYQFGPDIFPKMNNLPLAYIPFYLIGECDDPPLIDLVNVNLSHYRVTASYEHGCHFTGLPTPVVTGYSPTDPQEKLYIGSTTAWIFTDPNAKATFLEFSGKGLDTLRENLNAKKDEMAVLGARMLEIQKKVAEAAQTAEIHRSGENSLLSTRAQSISDAFEKALVTFCRWAGADVPEENTKDVVKCELNRDFYPASMPPQMLDSLVKTWQSGALSKRELFATLQENEIIDKEKSFEDHEAEMEAEGPKLMAGLASLLGPAAPPNSAAPTKTAPAAPAKPSGKKLITNKNTGVQYTVEDHK